MPLLPDSPILFPGIHHPAPNPAPDRQNRDGGLRGRSPRGAGGEEDVVGRFKSRNGLEPSHREKGRRGRRRRSLHQRQRPKVTHRAAVFGGLVNLERGGQRMGLRGDRGAKHEQDHREPRPEWHASCQVRIIIADRRRRPETEDPDPEGRALFGLSFNSAP
jgi:hypothetical protein